MFADAVEVVTLVPLPIKHHVMGPWAFGGCVGLDCRFPDDEDRPRPILYCLFAAMVSPSVNREPTQAPRSNG